ncbi:MAG: hypothetical protein K2L51_03720, partial [Clostridiales bacterium]|nr:hypothetical protein [Clostridiales bacterium]
IYSGQKDYAVWDTPKEFAPRAAIVRKGGEIGAGCTGYKAEIFIPNEAINESATPDGLQVFLCAIASYSSQAGEQLRAWKGLNIEQKIVGLDWDRPNTWYLFDAAGFVANKVTVTANEGGTAVCDYNYTLNGMKNGITINPAAGYRIAAFKQNGRELFGQLVAENGVSRYVFTGAGTDLAFDVTFEAISTANHTVNGAITCTSFMGAPSQEQLNSDIESVTLQTAANSYAANVSGNSYSVIAPAGTYTLIVRSVRGFVLASKKITLQADATENIALDENAWLGRRFVELDDRSVTANASYATLMYGLTEAKTFTFGARIAVPYSEGTIVPEVRFNYNADRFVRVQLMNWNGSYCVKAVVSGIADKQTDLRASNNNQAYADRLKENGGYVIVAVNAATGAVNVYLDDGDGFDS